MAERRHVDGRQARPHVGVANDRSIAWGIAKAVADHGAELAFTYQGEAIEEAGRAARRRSSAPSSCCPAT